MRVRQKGDEKNVFEDPGRNLGNVGVRAEKASIPRYLQTFFLEEHPSRPNCLVSRIGRWRVTQRERAGHGRNIDELTELTKGRLLALEMSCLGTRGNFLSPTCPYNASPSSIALFLRYPPLLFNMSYAEGVSDIRRYVTTLDASKNKSISQTLSRN